MTVRFKIALTILLTGLLTAVGIISTLLLAFERFDHEATYHRSSAFLERVVARHSDVLSMQERFPDDFKGFLSNLVLFEPDTQVYLLNAQGKVITYSGDMVFPKDLVVALKPVQQAASIEPMPYVLGDNPERMGSPAVIAARPLHRATIGNFNSPDGYLYLVSCRPSLPTGGIQALQSAFAKPTLILILAMVAASTLLAAWVTSAVTRPLKQLTATVASIARTGIDESAIAETAQTMPREKAHGTDEFGQLGAGIQGMLVTLRTQWAMLRRLDHFRREGVSNLSHDLRSPLTATAACLETLENNWAGDALRTADRQLVEVALRNTRNAARLVRSLGDLAQLDEPTFSLNKQVLNATELLDDIAVRFAEKANSKGVIIALAEALDDTRLPAPMVDIDVELIERALANLVDNALKVCTNGARICLNASRMDDEVLLSVKDTGPGIAPEDIDHLFDRFYQSRTTVAPATSEGGKGLGLAIVKRIAELHSGRVAVESTLRIGTTVTLVLPAAALQKPNR